MQIYRIRKVNKQLYTVEILFRNLSLRLRKVNKLVSVSKGDRFFSFQTSPEEEKLPNAGESKFLKILKEEDIGLKDYSIN